MNIYVRLSIMLFTCVYFFSSTLGPVLASMTYTYDANGNMSSDGTKCYEYNDANQLKKVKNCSNNQTIAEYAYDYKGNRIVKKQYQNGDLQKTVISPNDNSEIMKLASNSAKFNTTYYYANDQLISKKDPYGNRTYYHNDHLGSASLITNQSGVVVEETKYDPWGKVISGGIKSKFQYTGQEKDDETGLNYYNARYYDPHIRRFTQPDDIIPDIYNPQTLNRYSYVNNNPLRYTDPSGHCGIFTPICLAFVAADEYFLGGIITAAIVKYSAPIIQAVTKFVSGPNANKVVQTGTKVQSNPIVQKTESNLTNSTTNVANSPVNKVISNLGNVTKSGVSNSINIAPKIESKMQSRGWTQDLIQDTVENPTRKVQTRDWRNIGDGTKMDDPATGYVGEDGSYVVLNDKTNDVVQISNRFDPFWKAPWDK